jgi:hypothetical protein
VHLLWHAREQSQSRRLLRTFGNDGPAVLLSLRGLAATASAQLWEARAMSDIAEVKKKLPLPVLMQQLGLGKHAKKSAKCPFHEDQRNSFSVWRNGSGLWFWKCHAGCGEGDEITFLEKHKRVSNREATKRYLEMAGVNGTTPSALKPRSTSTVDWPACVAALTDRHIERLAKWRGYSIEFCSWLRERSLVGLYNGYAAFPVHDRAGNVVAAHYRLADGSWRYHPQGAKVRPLVVRELDPGKPIHVFESQWDAFAFMNVFDKRSGIVITRGAGNGALLSELVRERSTLYLWTQNDPAGHKWQKDVCAKTDAVVSRVKIPEQHKDLDDWMRAGATRRDLFSAIMRAELICEAKGLEPNSTGSSEITQLQPFPLHCLAPVCEAMARAICETVRVPESLPGCCILGIQSAAIGKGLQVKSGANRVTRGNLYILPSAESGSGKSETSRHSAKPFLQFEAERLKAWKVETLPGLLAERDILESEIAELKKQAGKADDAVERDEIRSQLKRKRAALEEIEIKLRAPVLSCEDITSQKLAELLAHNGEQLASLSADAGEIVNVLLGRYNKLDRTDESVYVKAFTGDYCKVDRKSSEPVLLQSPCLSALWLTQPDKLDSLLAERSLSDGGLIPRILTCHTRCEAREIVQNAPEIPVGVENDYANLIRRLIETYRLADEPFTIEPAPEALEAMNAHYNAIVKRRRSDLRDVTIYAARWNEQAWRIAVCLHAGLHGAHAHEHTLELDTAKWAIELADWFAVQQLEILSASRYKARRKIWDEVLSLLADKPEGIRASDVYRVRIARNADEAHALLAAMEAGGELAGRDEQPESGGHVTRIFTRAKK